MRIGCIHYTYKNKSDKKLLFFSLVDELPTDLKETCAEKEARAKGRVVQMLHKSHEEKK